MYPGTENGSVRRFTGPSSIAKGGAAIGDMLSM
jgi:hypothetical protein